MKITVVSLFDGSDGEHYVGAVAGSLDDEQRASTASRFNAQYGVEDEEDGRYLHFREVDLAGSPDALVHLMNDCDEGITLNAYSSRRGPQMGGTGSSEVPVAKVVLELRQRHTRDGTYWLLRPVKVVFDNRVLSPTVNNGREYDRFVFAAGLEQRVYNDNPNVFGPPGPTVVVGRTEFKTDEIMGLEVADSVTDAAEHDRVEAEFEMTELLETAFNAAMGQS